MRLLEHALKYIFTLRTAVLIGTCAVPSVALAHTKWFAHGSLAPYVTNEPTGLYLGVWALVALCTIGAGVFFERTGMFRFSFLEPRTPRAFERASTVFSMVVGSFLVIGATHSYLFSPNLDVHSGIPPSLLFAELIIGITLLVGIGDRIAAVALALLWGGVWLSAGGIAALEDVWVLSTALFIMIMGNDFFRFISAPAPGAFMRKYERYALPVLRLGTGATLFILGFSEKILHPEYGINFLSEYHWNFMRALGAPYSDYLFTLSAGSVESLLGLVFILGIVTRFNALILAIFFSIPLFIIGPFELIGHVPHFAAVVLLLLFGSGDRLKLPVR